MSTPILQGRWADSAGNGQCYNGRVVGQGYDAVVAEAGGRRFVRLMHVASKEWSGWNELLAGETAADCASNPSTYWLDKADSEADIEIGD